VNREDVHRAWAPANDPWSAWVKPVLFANLDDEVTPAALDPAPDWLRRGVVDPLRATRPEKGAHPYRGDAHLADTTLVIDLPGAESTRVGVGSADFGFRPVPLYNAVPAPFALVELRPIMTVLVDASERIGALPPGRPPAFMLDADRASAEHLVDDWTKPATVGLFDNRSVCNESDFPSAERLWQAGIRRAVLIQSGGERPALDLEPILLGWQRYGIALWLKRSDAAVAAAPVTLRRSGWLRRLGQWLHDLHLHPRADGAYGALRTPHHVG
jgi:hypothetical protein